MRGPAIGAELTAHKANSTSQKICGVLAPIVGSASGLPCKKTASITNRLAIDTDTRIQRA
jgi:hypothetical protein